MKFKAESLKFKMIFQYNFTSVFVMGLLFLSSIANYSFAQPGPVPFARNGGLKMFYDSRMYPQAVRVNNSVFIVWRGKDGLPYITDYKIEKREFSKEKMLLKPWREEIEPNKYLNDHHYAPVIWADQAGYLHVISGLHGTPGIHVMSENPGSIETWVRRPSISTSISYPQVHRAFDDQILVYYRHAGHLGNWQYRLSNNGGITWTNSLSSIDLNAEPHNVEHASYSGSYNTTALSADGKNLHIAFIWKVEEPVFNKRYEKVLDGYTQRYNLYYIKVNLTSGEAVNIQGEKVILPVTKKSADLNCLVWDTEDRVSSVGPSIAIDVQDQPHFLVPISEASPHSGYFYYVRFVDGDWEHTRITETLHPFNSGHLVVRDNGDVRAFMITGKNEEIPPKEKRFEQTNMDFYGYGRDVELWESKNNGNSWGLIRKLSPPDKKKFQSVKFVSDAMTSRREDMVLFYGWDEVDDEGTAYLWDGRIE